MGMLDGILAQIGGDQVAAIAGKVGLSEDQVKMAMEALGQAHPQPGDTVTTAAAATGLSVESLTQLVSHMGGENALATLSSMADVDHDGNPVNDIMGMAGKLFGR